MAKTTNNSRIIMKSILKERPFQGLTQHSIFIKIGLGLAKVGTLTVR